MSVVVSESPQLCPLCGQPNQCGMAQSPATPRPCWCEQAKVSADALARIPESQRGKACLCPRCAQLDAP